MKIIYKKRKLLSISFVLFVVFLLSACSKVPKDKKEVGETLEIKDESIKGPACIYYEKQEKPKFYHWNPFFTVNVVSDDEDFINRSAMPF